LIRDGDDSCQNSPPQLEFDKLTEHLKDLQDVSRGTNTCTQVR